MISIAICDDDAEFSEKLAEKVKMKANEYRVSVGIEVFGDGRDLVDFAQKVDSFDIIFLDIEMKHVNGLEAARNIRKFDKESFLVYITNYAGYSIEAYSVRPYQFLLKPLNEKKFDQIFKELLDEISHGDAYFRYAANKQSHKILIRDIVYFESKGRSIYIVTNKNENHKYNGKLSNIEEVFAQSQAEFWRIHQSYLVNRKHIYRIEYTRVEMSNGIILPISEDKRKIIRQNYLGDIGAGIIE